MAKGSKTCPNCKDTCGPRSLKCKKCGYDYFPNKKPVEESHVNVPINTGDEIVVSVPSKHPKEPGEFCPIKPHHLFDDVEINKWVKNLRNHRFMLCNKNARYDQEAIEYFVHGYWPEYIRGENNPDYKRVIELVRKEFNDFPNVN